MRAQIRKRYLGNLLIAGVIVAGWMMAVASADPSGSPTVLTPDRTDSVVVVYTESGASLTLRVATLSAQSNGAGLAPGPVRTAFALEHPLTGEIVDVNLVEVGHRTTRAKAGLRPRVELLVNQELPFTARTAEVLAAGGLSPYVPQDLGQATFPSVCWWSGDPVQEVFVSYDASMPRTSAPAYVLDVVGIHAAPSIQLGEFAPIGGNGDPFDNPNPPGTLEAGGGDGGSTPGEGGDPVGDPGRRD